MSSENTPPPTADADEPDSGSGSRFPRWLTWSLLGLVGAVVVFYGGLLVYVNFIRDDPAAFDESDLEAALADGSVDEPTATEPPAATTEPPAATTEPPEATDPPEPADEPTATEPPAATTEPPVAEASAQQWVVTDASELGYRVKEILFGVDTEAVGRTNQIEGSFTIEGTQVTDGGFVVDVATITSDESRRDGQFRGRIMAVDQFPEAMFVLTQPIELGAEPVEGTAVSTTATGELTLRGTTREVTFDLDARLENDRIGVLGNIPVVFEDYGVPNPSTAGITTEDNGLLEFVLVFDRE